MESSPFPRMRKSAYSKRNASPGFIYSGSRSTSNRYTRSMGKPRGMPLCQKALQQEKVMSIKQEAMQLQKARRNPLLRGTMKYPPLPRKYESTDSKSKESSGYGSVCFDYRSSLDVSSLSDEELEVMSIKQEAMQLQKARRNPLLRGTMKYPPLPRKYESTDSKSKESSGYGSVCFDYRSSLDVSSLSDEELEGMPLNPETFLLQKEYLELSEGRFRSSPSRPAFPVPETPASGPDPSATPDKMRLTSSLEASSVSQMKRKVPSYASGSPVDDPPPNKCSHLGD